MKLSKNKQDYILRVTFDPSPTVGPQNSYFEVTDSTMSFGEKLKCEFKKRKNMKEHNKSVKELVKFAKGLTNQVCFKPIEVIVRSNDGEIFSGTVMCRDNNA
jgi:hypothetical protein